MLPALPEAAKSRSQPQSCCARSDHPSAWPWRQSPCDSVLLLSLEFTHWVQLAIRKLQGTLGWHRREGVPVHAVISYLLQVPASLWPLLGVWAAACSAGASESLRLSAVLADVLGVQQNPMPGSWTVLTAPLCPQDLLLHDRQAAEQSLCLRCPEPGERGPGVPCLPLTQEEDCKHLLLAL